MSRPRPLYICDLDGTLADTEHRDSIIRNKADPHRWTKFYAACVDDKPNWPVWSTICKLLESSDIYIWSGRSDEVKAETIAWLQRYIPGFFQPNKNFNFRMRKQGDYTRDADLKLQWYEELSAEDHERLVAVFDDRDRMVRMWRDLGICCFQVKYGDY